MDRYGRDGMEVDYDLYLQCSWRFTDCCRIVLCLQDIYAPGRTWAGSQDETFPWGNCSKPGLTLGFMTSANGSTFRRCHGVRGVGITERPYGEAWDEHLGQGTDGEGVEQCSSAHVPSESPADDEDRHLDRGADKPNGQPSSGEANHQSVSRTGTKAGSNV